VLARIGAGHEQHVNVSKVVQHVLETFLDTSATVGGLVERRSTASPERLNRIVDRHRASAQELFDRGYEVGLAVAEALNIDQFGRLREAGWFNGPDAVAHYLDPRNADMVEIVTHVLETELGPDYESQSVRGSVLDEGTIAAFEDVWARISEAARPRPGSADD
jgi:hypothetical protein